MASGRVLIVHNSGATRSLLLELLAREGIVVAAAESTYAAMAHFVDEPADIVVLGLNGLDETELEFITALKKEEHAPRVLLAFPSPQRDLAVRALTMGADGYVLEPFYGDEIVALVKGMLPRRNGKADSFEKLAQLAREVAHAVNNPLQVLSLLLAKDKVTKRELMKGIPEQTERVEKVIEQLRAFSSDADALVAPADPRPAAEASNFLVSAGDVGTARIDPALYTDALNALHAALAARGPAEIAAQLAEEAGAVTLRCTLPRQAFLDEDPTRLLDEIFVVGADREIRPGLARARRLLATMGGSLRIEQSGDQIVFIASVQR